MPPQAGSRLGPYELTAPIGGGGLEFGTPERLPFPSDALALGLGTQPIRLIRGWRQLVEK